MGVDQAIAIFPRFDELNMLNLMSLQSEIVELRKCLRQTCQLDDESDSLDESRYSLNFKLSKDRNSEQHRLLTALRPKLREYNELLLQATQLSQLSSPKASQLGDLRAWLSDGKGGNCFQSGSEVWMWEDEDKRRYVRVGQDPEENDQFTEMIKTMAIRLYHRIWGERHGGGRVIDEESDLRSYDESRIVKASNIMATTLSSILPVLAIFALNQLQSTNLRIALAAVFTAVFAFILAFISTAKRAEIFTATATFAAVEVVFIGSAIGAANNPAS